jgi:hypothetical protein
MTSTAESGPIFVHASPRSGSTYFFNVLRGNETLLCFNEAIIDGKHDLARYRRRKRSIDYSKRAQRWDVNHHFLDREDFDEFIQAWDAVMHLCPKFPTFLDYLPSDGRLSSDITVYLSALIKYAQSQGQRPVFCEINSRGRAGALRGAFGGFHIAQYRDPMSQFGSFIRAVIEGGFWGFLAFPATELGTSSTHPLYRLIPEIWRPAPLPWLASSRAQHWASDAQYFAAVGSSRAENFEHVFRWHMFSWILTNLAAISYSDLAMDIDKVHDDANYCSLLVDRFQGSLGVAIDLSDVRKFDRYYEFEAFDTATVSDQVISTVNAGAKDGSLANAICTLGTQAPITSTAIAVELLIEKIRASQASMAASPNRRRLSCDDWKSIVDKNRKIWFNPGVRRLAQHVYLLAAPVVRAARRAGIWYRARYRSQGGPTVNT